MRPPSFRLYFLDSSRTIAPSQWRRGEGPQIFPFWLAPQPPDAPFGSFELRKSETGTRVGSSCDRLSRRNCGKGVQATQLRNNNNKDLAAVGQCAYIIVESVPSRLSSKNSGLNVVNPLRTYLGRAVRAVCGLEMPRNAECTVKTEL